MLVDLRLPAPLQETGRTPSREERLLGLFKVWSVIRYLDPHVELCDMDWSACLAEWIPKVEEAESLLAYARTLRMLTAHLHDNNVFYFFPNLPESQSLPVFFAWVEGKIIVTDVMEHPQISQIAQIGASDSGPDHLIPRSLDPSVPSLQVGDEVVEFDGKTVQELVTEHRLQVSYSTEGAFYQRMCEMLVLGQAGSEVKLVIRRKGVKGQRDKGIESGEAPVSDSGPSIPRSLDPSIPCLSLCLKRTLTREARIAYSARRGESSGYRVLEENVGYMDLGRLASLREFERAFEALRGTNGLIVDIRRHPGFTMQLALASRLSDRPVKSAIYEIRVVSGFDSQEQVVSTGQYDVQPDAKAHYGGPVVVLVNEKTIGSAEDVCIYLKNAGRGTFVGGTTAGCNGNRTWISLPGGGRLWFTGMRVKFGDGSRFQNVGIIPDVQAAPTVEGVRAGRDEILEKGIEVLRSLVHRPSSEASQPEGNDR